MDSRRRFVLGFALLGFGLAGCQSAMMPKDPKEEIPDWTLYRNASIGFYFRYPPILDLEESDRELEGTEVSVLYPGMRSVVFQVEVEGATAERTLLAKMIPGTEEACRVGAESGLTFRITGEDGMAEARTLVKKDGWIFVFKGTGKTFEEIIAGFRFGTPPEPSDDEKARSGQDG